MSGRHSICLRTKTGHITSCHVRALIRLKLAAVLCRVMGVGKLDGSYICREVHGAAPRMSVKIVVALLLAQVVAGRISKKRQG